LVVVVVSLFFAGNALSSDGAVQVFIKDGILFGNSEQALVESNLLTGALSIRYSDGSIYESRLDTRRMQVSTLANFDDVLWITSQEGARDPYGLMGICSSEAAAVQAAVTLVQNACAGGETTSCSDARAALQSAQGAFDNCIRQYLEMY